MTDERTSHETAMLLRVKQRIETELTEEIKTWQKEHSVEEDGKVRYPIIIPVSVVLQMFTDKK